MAPRARREALSLAAMEFLSRTACPYTAFFCEENIWQLADRLVAQGIAPEHLQVLLFSNPWQSVYLLNQQAAKPSCAVLWDYHVVLLLEDADRRLVFDPDSRLPFPVDCDDYLRRTFPAQATLPPRYRTLVRRIPGAAYLARFASDRSHMRGRLPETEFPGYAAIQPPPGAPRTTLDEYRDMQRSLPDGGIVQPVSALCAEIA